MPYRIQKKGSKWVDIKEGGKVMGTHDTKKEAREQQKALYASENYSEHEGRNMRRKK